MIRVLLLLSTVAALSIIVGPPSASELAVSKSLMNHESVELAMGGRPPGRPERPERPQKPGRPRCSESAELHHFA